VGGDGPYCVILDIVKLDNAINAQTAQNSQKMVVVLIKSMKRHREESIEFRFSYLTLPENL
jgi:hypothetical protein